MYSKVLGGGNMSDKTRTVSVFCKRRRWCSFPKSRL